MQKNQYSGEVVVFTGGSNAGKSSIMGFLMIELPKFGLKPFILHEVATTLFTAGLNHEEVPNTQELIITKMISDEEILKQAARAYTGPLRPIVISDRGIKDCEIFCKPGEYADIIKKLSLTDQEIKNRYSLVIHLRSTALGNSDLFERTFGGNPVRIEKSKQEVADGDGAIERVWLGSRKVHYIPLAETFDEKKNTALQTLLQELGMPVPQSIQKKFLVPNSFSVDQINKKTTVLLTQYYLDNSPRRALMHYPKDATRISEMIRVTQDGTSMTYTYTLKAYVPGEAQPYVLHSILDQNDFVQLVAYTNGRPLKKYRTYFTWNNQYFQHDSFLEKIDAENHNILEVQPSLAVSEVILPPFVSVIKEVTSDSYYDNASIAARIV